MRSNKIYLGEAKEVLEKFPSNSIDMCMTSPPYWALRDYGKKEQLGLEPDFNQYIVKLCDVFDEVKRVLKKEGTCWVNLGDTYYSKSGNGFQDDKLRGAKASEIGLSKANEVRGLGLLPTKCLSLIPFRFAIEMVNRGWIIRNVIVWHKPNVMPSSARDRFTVDFEYLFLFAKSKKYYFNKQYEPQLNSSVKRMKKGVSPNSSFNYKERKKKDKYLFKDYRKVSHDPKGRNKRCVWKITTKPFRGKHFAVYPEQLCEIPIKAGCPKNGIVLDPFFGAGTTGLVASKQNKKFIGIDLNPSYIEIAKKRIQDGSQ